MDCCAENVKVSDNPADKLVAVINENRTTHKDSSLFDNSGLASLSLQYIKAYQGDCGVVGGSDAKKPYESQSAEEFAPSYGVKASTFGIAYTILDFTPVHRTGNKLLKD
ncbi:hypothetical protein TSUD_377050 [Trifolium subterraneum]|uniref:Uncharacterized protein n=1 Tax=Trifolium subterraneum TaxID=3900 RepID=A0A2Z6LZ62_TRISU|nr:hypothetical protein TSUD_377050 [Trifolium subterraneum]